MQDHSGEPVYRVQWPLARIEIQSAGETRGLPDLSGKTVAELWDQIFRGDIAYQQLREHLKQRFPGIRFVEHTQFGNIHGPKQREILDALPEKLRAAGVDAVISGIGA